MQLKILVAINSHFHSGISSDKSHTNHQGLKMTHLHFCTAASWTLLPGLQFKHFLTHMQEQKEREEGEAYLVKVRRVCG